ncbi:HTH_Tnp_Tc3_1 domain-containing protein [Trichonephila clavipes]|nr:HTH_Tnp_Tc3_1 domain-containing protein [Trichonephila clavipes]
MAGYQDLSEFERGVIVGTREMEHSISEVAMNFGFSRTTISQVFREYRESGKISNLRHHYSRKKYMQERDQRQLMRIIKRDRRASLPQIAADFNAGPSTSVTMRTIQRNIIDMSFRSRRPTRVPLLTAPHKALSLAWAHQHRHWTVDDWKHVAWFDESHFQLNRVDGHVRLWRQPHESMDPTCQQGNVQAGGGSVMQDNATPHTSRITTEWLQEHSSEFRHFRCPSKSPDMNIIQYIWDALQRAVQKSSPPPLTPTNLWTTLKDS